MGKSAVVPPALLLAIAAISSFVGQQLSISLRMVFGFPNTGAGYGRIQAAMKLL